MQKEMKDILCNDLNHILACALEKMKQEQGSVCVNIFSGDPYKIVLQLN